MTDARPRVLINFASSLDGKINPAPGLRQGLFMMSRDREDFRRMLSLRAEADAILIGATNLRADNPDLAIPPDERAARRARGEPEPALGGPPIALHAPAMPVDTRARLGAVAELVQFSGKRVAMSDVLTWLAG